jgi:outer membrane protein assembly factor BamB/tetratricopeptide (TPR) repeat protein
MRAIARALRRFFMLCRWLTRAHLLPLLLPFLLAFTLLPAHADEALNRTVLPADYPSAVQRLQSARKYVRDQQYAEAVDEYQRLLEEARDKLAPLSAEHFVQVRLLCHADLAALPPEGLRLYRNRVDPQAQKWLEQGSAQRDMALLRRVVDEAFCSRAGDRALDLLGDLAFERARFEEAERWWRYLARPAPEVLAKQAKVGLDLLFPDPEIAPARSRAKQLLARLFQGEPQVSTERLQEELRAFRQLHADAAGHLAGREGKYADILQALLAEPPRVPLPPGEIWTTFAGGPGRNLVLPPAPNDPNRLIRFCSQGPQWRFNLTKEHTLLESHDPLADPFTTRVPPPGSPVRSLAFHPLIVGDDVLVADTRYVTAYNWRTGKSNIWYDLAADNAAFNADPTLPATPDLRCTLTVGEDCVLARLGAPELAPGRDPRECESFLVCLNLTPGTKGEHKRWVARPKPLQRELVVFEGAPLVHDSRVYIAATHFPNGRCITAIHCYPLHAREDDPPLRWRQEVCEITGLRGMEENRARHHLLTLAGDNVVYCSHSGAVIALDAATGHPAWAMRYPSRGLTFGPDKVASPRDLTPCLFAAGRLYVAPADIDRLLCLDPVNGRLLWQLDKVEVVHLLGVAHGRLIFTTPQGIRAIGATNGSDREGWIQPADGTALPSFGRGFLTSDHVYWPTRGKLYVLNQTDGEQPDNLLPGPWQDIRPGNLVLGENCFAVADAETLSIFPAPAALRNHRARRVQEQPRSALAHYQLALAELDAGTAGDDPASLALTHALEDLAQTEQLARPGECWQGRRLVELARSCRQEVLLQQAERAAAQRRWDEADELLARAATREHTVAERLEALRRRAHLWRMAGRPEREAAVWQSILADEVLRSGQLTDAHGLPQSAARVAAAPAAPRPERSENHPPTRDDRPNLTLPLASAWQLSLAPDERLLRAPPEAATEDGCDLFFGRENELVCRNREAGQLRWRHSLAARPEWVRQHADIVLAANAQTVQALTRAEGAALWGFVPEPGQTTGPLNHFRLRGGRLFFVQGGQRLWALDAESGQVLWARWAPGARLGLSSSSGRFHRSYQVGDTSTIVQTSSGKLWILDSATGRVLHIRDTTREPWVGPALVLDERYVWLVPDARSLVLLDTADGQEKARVELRATSTLTGQSPRLVGDRERVVLLVDRTYGPALQRIEPLTGQPLWDAERPLGTEPVDALLCDSERIYCTSGDLLAGRSLADGKTLWTVPLRGPGKGWQLGRTRDYLVAYPTDVGEVEIKLSGWFSSFQAATLPLVRLTDAGFPVLFHDPKTGQLVERLNLRSGRPYSGTQRAWGELSATLTDVRLVRPVVDVRLSGQGVMAAASRMVRYWNAPER